MKDYFKKNKLNIAFAVLSLAFMLAVWLIAYYSVKNDYIVPPLGATFQEVGKLFISGAFWVAFSATVGRTLLAFLIALSLAVCLAAVGALYTPFKAFMRPIAAFCRIVPTMAVVIILLLFPNTLFAPVIITLTVLFPKLYATVAAALDGVDKDVLQMAQAFSVPAKTRIFKIYIPQAAANVLSQAGTDISFGLKLTVSAEVLCYAAKSLGGLMQDANINLRIAEFFALTILAVVFGFIIETAFLQLNRITARWRQ